MRITYQNTAARLIRDAEPLHEALLLCEDADAATAAGRESTRNCTPWPTGY
ncbi:hypothetical protein [Streptomyces aureocirculatus]|uniref:hypothetical protein n=1 Tax=Streptomyces aureocirculatus TaxID=67275 RepID=UPI000A63DF0C|nr:hypothetical protein [Streptomyces aureocirculatus]